MSKCIFNKKSHLKGKSRCEITGKIIKNDCDFYSKPPCKYYKKSLLSRFFDWFDEKING